MTAKGILIMFRKVKIFGVGFNKTGTTSLACALESFGFRLGKQNKAELFLADYSLRQFHRIVKFCKKGDAFQDIPFSLNYTFETAARNGMILLYVTKPRSSRKKGFLLRRI
jgi:hypothetical protein